jgi:inositol transport system substrate-binding protein
MNHPPLREKKLRFFSVAASNPFRALFVVLVIMGLTSACARPGNSQEGSTSDRDMVIAFLYQDLENEWWIASHRAITEILHEQGVEVIERNAHANINTQMAQAREVAALHVDGVLMIAQDGDSALEISRILNEADIPVAVFGLPPSSRRSDAIVALPEEYKNAERLMTYLTSLARERFESSGERVNPLIIVGDMKDPNAVNRRDAFMDVYRENADIFNEAVEVPTKWDAATCLANLESTLRAYPEIDFIFASSDFFYPQIRAVLEPLGKWKPIGDPEHVILGGIDGDLTAGRLMDERIVDATAVHDLYRMSNEIVDRLIKSVRDGEKTPEDWLYVEGFTITQENLAERRMDMWGNVLRAEIE